MFKAIIRGILILGSFVFVILFAVRSCAPRDFPRPTEAFYVNDYAEMLDPALERYLLSEGEHLYETTKDIEEIGGMQIVWATVLIENESEIPEYDIARWYNEWQIGKNNMGVFTILFFINVEVEGETWQELTEIRTALGESSRPYYPTTTLSVINQNTFAKHLPASNYTYTYDDRLMMGVATYFNELLNIAYGDIYDDETGVIPQAEFEIEYEDYDLSYSGPTDNGANEEMFFLAYFFSPFGNLADKILLGVFLLTFSVSGGLVIRKGGGGSSLGGGIFIHR